MNSLLSLTTSASDNQFQTHHT